MQTTEMPTMDSGYEGLKTQQADNVSIYELENEGLVERIRHKLRGEIYDVETGRWVQVYKAHMNDEGLGKFMFVVESLLDKNITLSKLDLNKVYKMAYEINSAIIGVIFKKSVEYEIDPVDRDLIIDIIDLQVFSTLMRALDGGERTHRETIIKSIENVVDKQTHTMGGGGGVFASLNPFKKMNKGDMGVEM